MSRYAKATDIIRQLERAEEDADFETWNSTVAALEHMYDDIPDVHNYLANNCANCRLHKLTVNFNNGDQRTYHVNNTMQALADYYAIGRECCIGRLDDTRAIITAVKIERERVDNQPCLKSKG